MILFLIYFQFIFKKTHPIGRNNITRIANITGNDSITHTRGESHDLNEDVKTDWLILLLTYGGTLFDYIRQGQQGLSLVPEDMFTDGRRQVSQ